MTLALHAELAAALVLDEHADILGLRKQIEHRVDQFLEQRFGRFRRRGRVQQLHDRVELALDQANGLLIGDADHAPTRSSACGRSSSHRADGSASSK